MADAKKVAQVSQIPDKMKMQEFMAPAQDRLGHSADIHFRVPPGVLREIGELMEHKDKFGWVTPSDFERWAIRHALDTATRAVKGNKLSNVGAMNSTRNKMLAMARLHAQFSEELEAMEKTISYMEDQGDRDQVMPLLVDIQRTISAMDDSYWRNKWKKEMVKRFSRYLRGVSLTEFEDE